MVERIMISGSITDRMIVAANRLVGAVEDSQLEPAFAEARMSFEALMRSNDVLTELHSYISGYQRGKTPPIEDGKQGEIVLYINDKTFISLATYDQPAKMLHSHPVRGLFLLLSDSSFPIRRFKLPKNWRSDVFEKGAKLQFIGEETVRQGDVVQVDGTKEVLWFGYQGVVAVAKFLVQTEAIQNWAFDGSTLEAIDAEGTNVEFDSLRHTAALLREMDSISSIPGLREMSHHRAHFVRWDAIKALTYIDRNAGIERLKAAVNDPHPEIAVAASKALKKLAVIQE
jgi:hypothetical protein